jgi:CubicO group peptidase (beta-lactamase class C family)
MRHTAGLSYGQLGDGPAHQAYVANGFLDEDLTNASLVDRLAALPLEYQPGTVWHYNHATDVLGESLSSSPATAFCRRCRKPCSNLSAC